MLLPRFATALSVRTRLIILSLVPVVGFAAIGFAYISSERTVDAAFGSVRQSSRLAEASRVFKESLTTMQVRAKEFVAQPQAVLVSRFADAHDAAIGSLKDDPGARERERKADARRVAGRASQTSRPRSRRSRPSRTSSD